MTKVKLWLTNRMTKGEGDARGSRKLTDFPQDTKQQPISKQKSLGPSALILKERVHERGREGRRWTLSFCPGQAAWWGISGGGGGQPTEGVKYMHGQVFVRWR